MAFKASAFDEDVRRLIDEARRAPYLAEGEDKQLGFAIRAGGKEGEKARQRLIASHQRLVISIARQFLKSGKPLSELISDGKIGLVQAADKYDPTRGTKFATVATLWIRAAVQSATFAADDSADMPPSAKRKLYRIRKAEREMAAAGEAATDAAIAARLKLSPVTVKRLRERAPVATLPTVSLDDVIGGSETTLGELLVDETNVDPHTMLHQSQLKASLSAALAELEERERMIVLLRFGLADDTVVTLHELADQYQISPERVRQIEQRALRKLADGPHAHVLRSLIEAL